jgi:O-methyltransferase
MIGRGKFVSNLRLCQRVLGIKGDIVECGVWRGGMSAAMAEFSAGLSSPRMSLLFDSFEGLPLAGEVDGPAALAWQSDTTSPDYHDNCTASDDEARAAMLRSGVETFRIVKGWFEDTLPKYSSQDPRIALLRLDGDWYESTTICLRSLFQHVVPGGVVIIDDYGVWDGCTRAVHDFLAQSKATEAVRQTNLVSYLVKR